MNQPLRTSSALSLVILSSMIAGCATSQSRMASASQVNSKATAEVGLAMRAIAALNSNDVPAAIDFAERAVAKTPRDAALARAAWQCLFRRLGGFIRRRRRFTIC